MSFALNYYFGGLDTFGYHLVNVIIHILNGLTLFLLSYTILTLPFHEGKERENALMIAFLGSLLWLTHPIQTQAVSYIYQRLASLTAFFFLLSLLCYIKGRATQTKTRAAFFVFAILFGLCALFTKQNAATLPFFIILSEFFFFQTQPFKLDRKKLIFLILFAGLFILIAGIYLRSDFISRIAMGYEKREWTMLERVLTQPRVVIFYLSLLIFPHPSRLNLDHDFAISHSLFSPFTTFLSLIFIMGSIGFAIFLMRRNRLVSFALFWFFGNLVIESSILPLEMIFEHRAYLPSMGVITLIIALCFHLSKREWEKWVTALIIPFILLFSYWTYERVPVWGNTLALWSDASKKSPNKARPHYNLGLAYDEKGMWDEAISEYKQTLVINPRYAKAHTALGVVYNKKDMLDEAISEFSQDITLNPNLEEAHYNLGNVYNKKGWFDRTISEYKQALAINPHFAEAHHNLGLVYDKKGKLDEAISEYKQALAINPRDAKVYTALGSVYIKQGRLEEAISKYRQALAINPDYTEALSSLGNAYAQKGMLDQAITEWKRALAINPKYAEAHANLGTGYAIKGMFEAAMTEFKQALILNPDFTMAHYSLGLTYSKKGMREEAISEFKKAIAIDNKYAEAHSSLGAVYVEKGMLKEAIAECKQAISIKPNHAIAHYNLGTAYHKKGELDNAIVAYTRATAFKKDYIKAYHSLAAAYYAKGNYKMAISHCDKVVKLGGRVNPKLLGLLNAHR